MERLSTTPFGQRPVTAGLLAATLRHSAPSPSAPPVDKWHILRELALARAAFGVTDRDLSVLEGLLTFFPDQMLGGNSDMVVFPSNKALSARCHGMPESTLRRHIAALVHAGLILRHDSPNGKRYARRDGPDGNVIRAFGFDLVPLVSRAAEIVQEARAAQAAAAQLANVREQVSLTKRDAIKLAQYGSDMGYAGDWDGLLMDLSDLTRTMRRRLDLADLMALQSHANALLCKVLELLPETQEMSGNHAYSERQDQNSNTEAPDLELCVEKRKAATPEQNSDSAPEVNIPFALVLRALPEALAYAPSPVRSWRDLVDLGSSLRGMIGISPSAWSDAVEEMGAEVAALTICCLTERITDIRSPGGYMRHLTHEASEGRFSVTRLVMALIHRDRERIAS